MILKGKIYLEEQVGTEFNLASPGIRDFHTMWIARVEGELADGVDVTMERSAIHAGEALADLRSAIEDEGWEFRDVDVDK